MVVSALVDLLTQAAPLLAIATRRLLSPPRPRIRRGAPEMIATYLPWLLSVITIWMTLLAGNKHPKAWLVGLGNQLLWLIWICVVGAWGLLPMNIALWIVYGRNHFKWRSP